MSEILSSPEAEPVVSGPETVDPAVTDATETMDQAVDTTTETTDAASVATEQIEDVSEVERETKTQTQSELERIAGITGRTPDDQEVRDLYVALCWDRYQQLQRSYDQSDANNYGGTTTHTMVLQEGDRQDIATAKRELEEAIYVAYPKYGELDQEAYRKGSKDDYTRVQLRDAILSTPDLEDRRVLRDQFIDREEAKKQRERDIDKERREYTDELTLQLAAKAEALTETEIWATYQMNKGQNPEQPIQDRRDGTDGLYIEGTFKVDWTLNPHNPEVVDGGDDGSGETDGGDDGSGETDGGDDGSGETDGGDDTPEALPRERVDVPEYDTGRLPEALARGKNLNILTSDESDEEIKQEVDRFNAEVATWIEAQANNFLVDNPELSPESEEYRNYVMGLYAEAQAKLGEQTVDAMDGKGYTDNDGNIHGRSALRRFSAWMDRHGNTIRTGLAVVGAVGLIGLTGGIATGAIVPAFAIGTGTAIGAIKGAGIAGVMSRRGSEGSAVKEVSIEELEVGEMIDGSSSPEEISNRISAAYVEAIERDHDRNVRTTRRAMVLGGALGALFGSISFDSVQQSTQTTTVETQVEVPNQAPTMDTNMEIGRWQAIGPEGHQAFNAADVISKQTGTSYDYIESHIYEIIQGARDAGYDLSHYDQTHILSFEGNLSDPSNESLRNLIQYVANTHDYGTHTETVQQVVSNVTSRLVANLPATIGGWITGGSIVGALSREVANRTQLNATEANEAEEPNPEPEVEVEEQPESEPEVYNGPDNIALADTYSQLERELADRYRSGTVPNGWTVVPASADGHIPQQADATVDTEGNVRLTPRGQFRTASRL